MYTIIGRPSTRLTRVSWMLEELEQDYEIETAFPQSEEMKRFNPSGKGPVLVDSHAEDDLIIIDSAAICVYLADRHPEMNMTAEPGTADRVAIDSWIHFAQSDLEAPLWLKAKHSFILPEDMRLDVKAITRLEFAWAIAAMEVRLGDNEFAIGDRFTAADILLGHNGFWARAAKFDIAPANVNAYFDRILARPALARAREKEAAHGKGGNL